MNFLSKNVEWFFFFFGSWTSHAEPGKNGLTLWALKSLVFKAQPLRSQLL